MSVQAFEGFLKARVLDAIGTPGHYRRFLQARKEHGVEWAVTMCERVQTVQNALQELDAKEQELRSSPWHAAQNLLQHVAESNLPPGDLALVISTCVISRKTDVPCVVIQGKGRGSIPFHVASRFVGFLTDLWIIKKMDLLIKTFTRQCLEQLDPDGQRPLAEVVADLERTRGDDMRALARGFHDAYFHVLASITNALQTIV